MSLAVQQTKEAARNALNDAGRVLGLTDNEIARAVLAERATIRRWRRGEGTVSPKQRGRIRQLREIIYLVKSAVPSAEGAQWFRAPVPRLQGKTPAALVQEGRADEVIEALVSAPARNPE